MNEVGPQLEVAQPVWLLVLIIAVPWLIFWGRRSLANQSAGRQRWLLMTRTTIAGLLVLALSGLTLWWPKTLRFVAFAVDHSASVDASAAEEAAEFVRAATQDRDEDSWVVLPFSRQTASDNHSSKSKATANAGNQATNLQAAIELATAIVPAGTSAEIVLLSDGNQTDGDAGLAARRSRLPVSTLVLRNAARPEFHISEFHVPTQVAVGEHFRITLGVHSTHGGNVAIDVMAGDDVVVSETRTLTAGDNTFVFTERLEQSASVTARITPVSADPSPAGDVSPATETAAGDTVPQNNQVTAYVFTVDGPRVLMIEEQAGANDALRRALQAEGLQIDCRVLDALPGTIGQLAEYDAVILANISATDLTTAQMERFRRYVSHSGGGFLMLGGDQSFGLGGYYRTVVEEILPVACDFHKQQDKPGLGMMLVIDKSGSMGGQKIELAKDAARAAVELLDKDDQVGVIAFDGSAFQVSPFETLSDKTTVLDRIAAIEAGGGTNLYPALVDSFQALKQSTARLKHVIALSDGYSVPAEFESLIGEMATEKITVSTVGVADADPELLQMIARVGRGRYYFTNDPSSVPQIFAKETLLAGDAAINETPFVPQQIRATQVLQDVNIASSPPLLGYVMTRPKPGSEVLLLTEAGDPLLSTWRYGLGTAVAFTSDAGDRWAAPWLSWSDFGRFWGQVLRHCVRKNSAGGFSVDLSQADDDLYVTIESRDADGSFVNDAETTLVMVPPDPVQPPRTIRAEMNAPGRYEAAFHADQPGLWKISITERINGRITNQQFGSVSTERRDEFVPQPPNVTLLQSIAQLSGGMFNPSPDQLFRSHHQVSAVRSLPLWSWLVATAIILFVIDIALRRIGAGNRKQRIANCESALNPDP